MLYAFNVNIVFGYLVRMLVMYRAACLDDYMRIYIIQYLAHLTRLHTKVKT